MNKPARGRPKKGKNVSDSQSPSWKIGDVPEVKQGESILGDEWDDAIIEEDDQEDAVDDVLREEEVAFDQNKHSFMLGEVPHHMPLQPLPTISSIHNDIPIKQPDMSVEIIRNQEMKIEGMQETIRQMQSNFNETINGMRNEQQQLVGILQDFLSKANTQQNSLAINAPTIESGDEGEQIVPVPQMPQSGQGDKALMYLAAGTQFLQQLSPILQILQLGRNQGQQPAMDADVILGVMNKRVEEVQTYQTTLLNSLKTLNALPSFSSSANNEEAIIMKAAGIAAQAVFDRLASKE